MAQRSSRQKRKRKRNARQGPAGYARARDKDAEARAALVPLEPGERPRAVTVGAVVAGLGAASNLVGLIAGFGKPGALAVGMLISVVVAVGMWRARYWAVLGMQTLLVIVILSVSLALLFARNVGYAILFVAVIAAAGSLFWFLIKAMARIQMPERPGASRRE